MIHRRTGPGGLAESSPRVNLVEYIERSKGQRRGMRDRPSGEVIHEMATVLEENEMLKEAIREMSDERRKKALPKSLKGLAVATIMMLAGSVGAEAQIADSVQVRIYDQADLVTTISPDGYRGFIGDTVTFTATSFDSVTGDTLDVEYLWTTDNPQAINVDPQTGFVEFLSPGDYNIYVEVVSVRIPGVAILGQFGPDLGTDKWQFGGDVPMQAIVGQTGLMCAMEYVAEQDIQDPSPTITYIGKSNPACPNLNGQTIPFTGYWEWTSSDPAILCFLNDQGVCDAPLGPLREARLSSGHARRVG